MNEIGNNLKRTRLLKKLSLKQAGDLLNMSSTAVAKYEKGDIIPDSQKLIEFSRAYNVNVLDLLKVYNKPQMKFIAFRKKKRLTGQNLDLLKDIIMNEVGNYIEVLSYNDINNTIKLPKYKCNCIEDAEIAAQKFRNFIEISELQPIVNLINILENLGIYIIQIKNSNNRFKDFDGLSEIVEGIPFIIILDDIKDGVRQRFTIAHELGHLLINCDKDNEETLCNRFASALLMPKKAIINEIGNYRKTISFYEYIAVKAEYKVSYAAINYRLKDLNIINDYLYKKMSIYISTHIGTSDPKPIKPEITYQYKKIVHKLENEDIISLNKACELLGETADEFNKEDYNYWY